MGAVLAHAKSREWSTHRYIRKEGDRYIYPEDLKGKSNPMLGSNDVRGSELMRNHPELRGAYEEYRRSQQIGPGGHRMSERDNRNNSPRTTSQNTGIINSELMRNHPELRDAYSEYRRSQERSHTAANGVRQMENRRIKDRRNAEEERARTAINGVRQMRNREDKDRPNPAAEVINDLRRGQINAAKERSKNYEPANMSRRNQATNDLNRTSYADAARESSRQQNEELRARREAEARERRAAQVNNARERSKDYTPGSGNDRDRLLSVEDRNQRKAQVNSVRERSKDYTPGSGNDRDRLPASRGNVKAKINRENARKEQERNLAINSRVGNSASAKVHDMHFGRTQEHSFDKDFNRVEGGNAPFKTGFENLDKGTKIYRQSDVNEKANKIGYTKNKVSREVSNLIKEAGGNWEKFKKKAANLSSQGKNLLASIFGWGK